MNTMLTGNRRLALRRLAAQVPRISAVLAALTGGVPSLDAASAGAFEAVTVAGPTILPAEFNGDLSKLPARPVASGSPSISRPLLLGPPSTKDRLKVVSVPTPPRPLGGPANVMPSFIRNFPGMSNFDTCGDRICGNAWPPSSNGDVGPQHYIQSVNYAYAIYDKTGTQLAAFSEDFLWRSALATPCDQDTQGQSTVLYDRLADRWILTHAAYAIDFFSGLPTPPFYQCIAASKTGDPVAGGWWLYAVRVDSGDIPPGYLHNDPKFGAWHDCIYMGANMYEASFFFPFTGVAFGSFSRADMYSGAPLTYSIGLLPYPASQIFSMFPSNNLGKGANAVLPGTPNYFVSESLSVFELEVRKFTAGANCGAGGTLGAMASVSQTPYAYATLGNEVPQPNTGVLLRNGDDRILQRLQYRRIGAAESLWVTHNVDVANGGPTGMQWVQINVTGGTVNATPVQQQIYAPDSIWRWMGSLAVDGQGNMALGYSTSSGIAPNYPSIAYSGRLAADPLNTLPQTEAQLIAGAGSQTVTSLWGFYSSMSIDPVDDCTFWYTHQYYSNQANGDSGNWQTRIASFRFPSCAAAIPARLLVPDGTSFAQTFSAYPEARWFVMTIEPGKTYVVEALDTSGDLTANAVGTLSVLAEDGLSPPEASVDCTSANAPRSPAVAVANDGLRCVIRAVPPNGTLLNKRPVYIKVTRMDPALGGGSQFKIRARESTIYGRWLTAGYDYHVEVENTTGDAMCVEVARYPASGLTYTAGPGWSGSIASFQLNVPAFGAVKQVIAKGSAVGRIPRARCGSNACAAPTNVMAGGLHVSTYAFDSVADRYIYFFTGTANEGKTRSSGERDARRIGDDTSESFARRDGFSGKGRIMSAETSERGRWRWSRPASGECRWQAQSVGPLANTSVANARVIVPDGSSLLQTIGGGETRWFVFGVEPGKTYVVEVVDPASDLVANTIGAVNVRTTPAGWRRRRKPRWIARRMRGRRRWRWRTTGSAAWCGRFRRRRGTPRTSGGSILPWRR